MRHDDQSISTFPPPSTVFSGASEEYCPSRALEKCCTKQISILRCEMQKWLQGGRARLVVRKMNSLALISVQVKTKAVGGVQNSFNVSSHVLFCAANSQVIHVTKGKFRLQGGKKGVDCETKQQRTEGVSLLSALTRRDLTVSKPQDRGAFVG